MPNYLDAQVLAEVSDLSVRARIIVDGFLSGLHRAKMLGQSLEFAQHRAYVPGDDLKNIDWKVYSRLDRWTVKQYENESNLNVLIVLDNSASMAFQGARSAFSKYAYASTLAASLAYLTLRQGDAAGLVLSKTSQPYCVAPAYGKSHLQALIKTLEINGFAHKMALETLLDYAAFAFKKPALLVVFSDFLGESALIQQSLKRLKLRHFDVMAVQILDTEEIEFPYEGEAEFKGLEDNSFLRLDSGAVAQAYRESLQNLRRSYQKSLAAFDIPFLETSTQIFPAAVLKMLLQKLSRGQ